MTVRGGLETTAAVTPRPRGLGYLTSRYLKGVHRDHARARAPVHVKAADTQGEPVGAEHVRD